MQENSTNFFGSGASATRAPGKKGRQIAIARRGTLAEVIRRLANREGSMVAAAELLGVTEGALRPYLSENRKAVNAETVEQLYAAFPIGESGDVPEEWNLLQEALLSEEGHLILASSDAWLDPRIDAFVKRRTGRWQRTAEGVRWMEARSREIRAARLGELCYVIGLLTSKFAGLFEPLRVTYQRYQHDHDRYILALVRIVEPLLEGRESGFIEIGWEELIEEDQRRQRSKNTSLPESRLRVFLRAAICQEKILLERESDDDRVHAMTQERTQLADPNWGDLLSQQLQNASTTQQQRAWGTAYNYYLVAAHNMGIKSLEERE